MDTAKIRNIFTYARQFVPNKNGMILQFFDNSHNENQSPYSFLNTHGYVGTSVKKTPNTIPSEYYIDTKKTDVPQLRLVLNASTLNPNSPFSMKRYSMLTPDQEQKYDQTLRTYIRSLVVDPAKAEAMRTTLLGAPAASSTQNDVLMPELAA